MREIRADMKKNILISVVVIASLGLLSCTTGITFLFYATTPLVSVIDICIDFYQGQGLDMDMNEILKQWYQNTGVRIEEAYTPECTWFSLAEAMTVVYYVDNRTCLVWNHDYFTYLNCFSFDTPEEVFEQIQLVYDYSPSQHRKQMILNLAERLDSGVPRESCQDYGFEGSTGCTAAENTYLPVTDSRNQRMWNEAYLIGGGNPFYQAAIAGGYSPKQCTTFAWFRFYQYYGFSSGAHGNGCTNARETVTAHPDLFKISSTPAPGAVISFPGTAGNPYGHVAFVEKVEGSYMWYSEGNYLNGGIRLNTKVNYEELRRSTCGGAYCITYAVSKG